VPFDLRDRNTNPISTYRLCKLPRFHDLFNNVWFYSHVVYPCFFVESLYKENEVKAINPRPASGDLRQMKGSYLPRRPPLQVYNALGYTCAGRIADRGSKLKYPTNRRQVNETTVTRKGSNGNKLLCTKMLAVFLCIMGIVFRGGSHRGQHWELTKYFRNRRTP